MATANDQSETPNTLPRPELNPLLNPLLGDNMGRWAEVYFTAPPEKREEAVLELVRELESGNSGNHSSITETPDIAPLPISFGASGSAHGLNSAIENEPPSESSPSSALPLRSCEACGHENPPSHQFCGMCGTNLDAECASEDEAKTRKGSREPEAFPHFSAETGSNRSKIDTNDLAVFRSISEGSGNDLRFTIEQSPARPYRVYLLAGLIVLLAAFGYTIWSGSQAKGSHEASPMPPAIAEAPTEPSTNLEKTISPTSEEPAKITPSPAEKAASSEKENSSPKNPVGTNQRPGNLAEQTEPAPTDASSVTAASGSDKTVQGLGDGNEEFKIAQNFLNGGNGVSRNGAEAAEWLWKAVAKHNSAATLALADLYLRGDGVSKNCDQARILLDSAAQKGTHGAGERLRNLPAFGCQ